MKPVKAFFLGILLMSVLVVGAIGGAVADRLFVIKPLDYIVQRVGGKSGTATGSGQVREVVVMEQNAIIDVVKQTAPSVVTISEERQLLQQPLFFFDPFGFFGGRDGGRQLPNQPQQQNIGSGFVIDSTQGLVVTNKHVVSDNGTYWVSTKDGDKFRVTKIYRDPANDLAILKVDAQLPPALPLGDSSTLQVGQYVIAIGTALGEFSGTVTTGVVSGLGRGIEAGNALEGSVEQLSNVIQTDAAINPGNSGGPLLNLQGQVIGVNVAVAQGGQNIGFALPINLVKESLETFNKTGQFNRPYLGVQYQMISRQAALMNEVPEGAYVVQVLDGSPAQKAGLQAGDIITKINNQAVKDANGGLAALINQTKVGDRVQVTYYRDGKEQTLTVVMEQSQS